MSRGVIGSFVVAYGASGSDLDLIHVHPYSNRVAVSVPAGCDRLVLGRPRGVDATVSGWSVGAAAPVPFEAALPVTPGTPVELHVRRDDERLPTAIKLPPPHPWAILRKMAMEARDRTLPLRA